MSWRVIRQFQQISLNIHKSLVHSVFIPKMSYYAVARGRTPGIFSSWSDCEAQVKGFSGARYKKFNSPESAQEFINREGGGGAPPQSNYYNNVTKHYPGTSKHNLKRPYSTSSNVGKTSKSSSEPTREPSESEDYSSDYSDDLATAISKQMDDIEKRVNNFEKGIDKIINKNTKKGSGKKAIMLEGPQQKKARSNVGFREDGDGFVQVYTDGACSANGRQSAKAGIGVYWGDGHSLNTSEPVSGRATNNCGEIQAATCAVKQAIQCGVKKLAINTDSKFLINSVTKWMPGWKKKGWKLKSGQPVKNETDFKELDSLQHKLQLKWNYVEAHRGVHGNEMADQLAKAGASMYNE